MSLFRILILKKKKKQKKSKFIELWEVEDLPEWKYEELQAKKTGFKELADLNRTNQNKISTEPKR